jgi:hypothetical protein
VKQDNLGEFEENAREKQNIQYTRQKHKLLKPSHMDVKHQFPHANQQIEKNQGVW